MLCSAIVFLSFPKHIVGIFTKDAQLFKIAIPIMAVLALFQLFDGLQISLAGICKGLKRTEIVLIANFVAYWLISIPMGYTMAFRFGHNLIGFWYGLVAASIFLCLIMALMLRSYFVRLKASLN